VETFPAAVNGTRDRDEIWRCEGRALAHSAEQFGDVVPARASGSRRHGVRISVWEQYARLDPELLPRRDRGQPVAVLGSRSSSSSSIPVSSQTRPRAARAERRKDAPGADCAKPARR
jgi:hypothetical protein